MSKPRRRPLSGYFVPLSLWVAEVTALSAYALDPGDFRLLIAGVMFGVLSMIALYAEAGNG